MKGHTERFRARCSLILLKMLANHPILMTGYCHFHCIKPYTTLDTTVHWVNTFNILHDSSCKIFELHKVHNKNIIAMIQALHPSKFSLDAKLTTTYIL